MGHDRSYALMTPSLFLPLQEADWDETHVWGRYREAALTTSVLVREIIVYAGGRTSLHRHTRQSELNFVVGGAIAVLTGEDMDSPSRHLVDEGDMFHVPAGWVHAVEFERAGAQEPGAWARFYEIVYNFRSADDIERLCSAVAGRS